MSDEFVLIWHTAPKASRPHYASLDDGRLAWTRHYAQPKPTKGKRRVIFDRVATVLTFLQAMAIKKSLCNPSLVLIKRAT